MLERKHADFPTEVTFKQRSRQALTMKKGPSRTGNTYMGRQENV